jgi:hypothetical protein
VDGLEERVKMLQERCCFELKLWSSPRPGFSTEAFLPRRFGRVANHTTARGI